MKRIAIVFALILGLLVSSIVPVMAKSLFNKKNGEAVVFGLLLNEINQSEKNRQAKRKADKKNEMDIERNRAQMQMKYERDMLEHQKNEQAIEKNRANIQMQMERDEYNRQKKMDELRFKKELENEKRYQREVSTSCNEDNIVAQEAMAVVILHDSQNRYKIEGDGKIFKSFESVRKYAVNIYPNMSMLVQEVDSLDE